MNKEGFPKFWQFCIAGFPASTQVLLKSGASAIPRAWLLDPTMVATQSSIFVQIANFVSRH
jgi:hypothetical protein